MARPKKVKPGRKKSFAGKPVKVSVGKVKKVKATKNVAAGNVIETINDVVVRIKAITQASLNQMALAKASFIDNFGQFHKAAAAAGSPDAEHNLAIFLSNFKQTSKILGIDDNELIESIVIEDIEDTGNVADEAADGETELEYFAHQSAKSIIDEEDKSEPEAKANLAVL